MRYSEMSREELLDEKNRLEIKFKALKEKNLNLNMARGKPGKSQLNLVSGLLDILVEPSECELGNVDIRNYGELSGMPEAKKYFSEILGVKENECFIGGNASLQLMYMTICEAFTNGLLNSEKPWFKLDKIKWLCPVPGYDRHFTITEKLGFEMINIPMLETGPDMDLVEELVKDESVKGMWNVPKFSNPQGIIYSDETIRRLAALKPAAKDFMLMWDNAYCIHEFDGDFVEFPDIIGLCKEYGNADMAYEFASTSKVTFPGAGISVMASSEANIKYLTKSFGVQVISFDKVNQIRHVKFLKDKANTLALMREHAKIMKPKFDTVIKYLDREIAPLGIGSWVVPKGGYFVSYEAMEHTAKRVLELAKEAGVEMTPAGATFPYRKDPQDSNIRIAPSLPPVEELEDAMDVFCVCARLAALEKLV
ncbi:MAG: aminotransferase class I/II-fold pyridoxal phosphate-dependent enzyme [[Eubacterium] sulci]|nr:aminotransferase class I/II-fold pyridoxal phosphate-dependent enzyme [[Eubacterium] sulci]